MKALIKKMRDSKKIDPADSLGKVKNMRVISPFESRKTKTVLVFPKIQRALEVVLV